MNCPKCGETRISWKKEMWGAGKEQFWETRKKIAFICGGVYQVDESTGNIEEEFNKCKRNSKEYK